jgi:hypothetical protein
MVFTFQYISAIYSRYQINYLHLHPIFSIIPLHWPMFTIFRKKVIHVFYSINASCRLYASLKYTISSKVSGHPSVVVN